MHGLAGASEIAFGFVYLAHTCILKTLFLAAPCHMRDLSSQSRDQTHAPCSGRGNPTHWTARESHMCIFQEEGSEREEPP